MEIQSICIRLGILCLSSVLLSACSTYSSYGDMPSTSDDHLTYPMGPQQYNDSNSKKHTESEHSSYGSSMPSHINTGEKTIVVDPNVHAWGAYDSQGELVRSGPISAGANYCPDIRRPCHTRSGSFRIQSLGSASCKSTIYPLPRGGAPMPYCMFFNGNQGLHGSGEVVEGHNVSHGCVRMHVADAEWVRFNFANIGTKVIVKPY